MRTTTFWSMDNGEISNHIDVWRMPVWPERIRGVMFVDPELGEVKAFFEADIDQGAQTATVRYVVAEGIRTFTRPVDQVVHEYYGSFHVWKLSFAGEADQ